MFVGSVCSAGGDPFQQADARVFGVALGVRLVPEVSVLGVGGDLVMRDGGPAGAEGFLADLLAKLVEAVSHEGRSVAQRRGTVHDSRLWSTSEISVQRQYE